MHSSISNSEIYLTHRWIPGGRWLAPGLVGLLIFLFAAMSLEFALAKRGFVPTILDTPTAWATERARASQLGPRALVLIGGSRIQLDLDLRVLGQATGLEPVQLAIDGSSFIPVLAELAEDDRIKGTILVDYYDEVVNDLNRQDGAQANLSEWARHRSRSGVPDFSVAEASLDGLVRRHMRSYADGASPFTSLVSRVLDAHATQQYLIMLPDRERRADYGKVDMPMFYYGRVLRNSGLPAPENAHSWPEFDTRVAAGIANLAPVALPNFDQNAKVIAGLVRRIEARGGHVTFVVMPMSGLVRATNERKFPRSLYWDRFVHIVRSPSLNFADVPDLAAFTCPDGSHLDMRSQASFTEALVRALPRRELPPAYAQ